MNDTTKWIMIILLLLLIAAAVFMLLRSPGKDSDKDGLTDAGGDADLNSGSAGLAGAAAPVDRGVYDQEADLGDPVREVAVGQEASSAAYAEPVADEAPAPSPEPVVEETYTDPTGYTETVDVHPLTDEEIVDGASDEPLTAAEQEPGLSPHDWPRGDEADEAAEVARVDESAEVAESVETAVPVETADAAEASMPEQSTSGQWWDADGPDPLEAARVGASSAVAMTPAPAVDDQPAAEHPAEDAYPTQEYPVEEAVPATEEAHPVTEEYAVSEPIFTEARFGPGSADPLEDGTGPAGWHIKGNVGSMLFHTPESPSYEHVLAEVWFESEEAARAAGFAHWDRRQR